ncbi:NmrA-like family protein [Lepidopterella palustris CBS 459.81]|uniref:NmrA-like family protein n=1 Tax=Lepidopterella palustris CBS 459.81 TaxID=1314670 RepID=A0A8E2EE39_9PEZI|nr:NmrA-like family protein [Lepidopterella palustris CBS 459.81]
MSRVLLITGATGKQGGAVVNSLLDSNFTILGVTRNASSPSALKLAAKHPKIKLVQGDLNDPTTLFKNAREVIDQSIWGVFSVQVPMGGGQTPQTEERQGKDLIDASIANDVKYFVYTSVDRGGEKSSSNPTSIPHFASKHNVEKHLEEKTAKGEMQWTILRPTAFLDNLTPDMMGKIFATTWKASLGDKPLQCIATSDIGWFSAQAFMKPELYNRKSISLAGCDLTFAQANEIFKEKVGKDLPTTFGFVSSALLWAVKEVGVMFKWFKEEGYGADIADLKKMHPGLLDLGEWLEKESKFETKRVE